MSRYVFYYFDKWYFRVSEVIAMSIVNKSLISLFWNTLIKQSRLVLFFKRKKEQYKIRIKLDLDSKLVSNAVNPFNLRIII